MMTPHGDRTSPNSHIVHIVAVAAIAAGAFYLTWRLVASFSAATLWLGAPLFVAELWGFAHLVLLTFQSWEVGDEADAPPPSALTGDQEPIHVVVTAHGAQPEDLRHTLLALQSVRGPSLVSVVDREHRGEIAALASEFDVELAVGGAQPSDAFWHAAVERRASFAAWLQAGHVPMPHFLEATHAHFADSSIAVVHSAVGLLNKDSLVHASHGRDEEALERNVLAPAMSRRGLAPWLGSGSLVRVLALRSVGGMDAGESAAELTSARLQAADWKCTYDPRPLVFRKAPDTLGRYLAERRAQVIERLGTHRAGVPLLRRGRLSARAWMSHLATKSSFGVGIQQLIITAVLIGSLVSGVVPVAATVTDWVLLWTPAAISGVVARHLLSRGTMAYGDWLRHGWRTLSADLSAFATLLGVHHRTRSGPDADGGFHALGRLRLLTTATLLLELAIVARGLTLVRGDLLPQFTASERVAVLGISLLSLAPMVDVLQVVVRRKQRRAEFRLAVRLPVAVDELRAETVDLSQKGMAFTHTESLELGQRVLVRLSLPHAMGPPSVLAISSVVRSLTADETGRWRIGVEFDGLDAVADAALFRFCAIDYPMHADEDHRSHEVHAPTDIRADETHAPGAMRVVTTVALCVGALVMVFGPTAPSALAAEAVDGSVCLSDSAGGPLAGGEARYYAGGWKTLGTTDATGCVSRPLPGQRTPFRVSYLGTSRELVQDTSVDSVVSFATVPVSVGLVDSAGGPLAGGEVRYYAGGWKTLGTTDGSGSVGLELLGQRTPFRVSYLGTSREFVQDTSVDSEVSFGTGRVDAAPGEVRSYYASGWKTFQPGMELLPGAVPFRLADGSTVRLSVVQGSALAVPSGEVTPVNAPTPTPTPAPTQTPIPPPTPTPTPTPTPAPTPTATSTAGPETRPLATPRPTATAPAKPTVSSTSTPTATATPSPTSTPTATPTPSPTSTPTATPTASPTPTVAATATAQPSPTGSPGPSSESAGGTSAENNAPFVFSFPVVQPTPRLKLDLPEVTPDPTADPTAPTPASRLDLPTPSATPLPAPSAPRADPTTTPTSPPSMSADPTEPAVDADPSVQPTSTVESSATPEAPAELSFEALPADDRKGVWSGNGRLLVTASVLALGAGVLSVVLGRRRSR